MATSNVLILARRALVTSVVAVVVAILALVAALFGDSGSDQADLAAPDTSQADVSAASAEVEAAAAMADLSAVKAEEAAATAEAAAVRAAAVEGAVAAALAGADGAAGADLVAEFEARLAEAEAAAAAAQAAAGESPTSEATPESDAPGPDAPESDAPESEAVDDESQATVEDEPGPASPTMTAPLPGEPYELGPAAGTALAVVGVAYDSALNVRDVPNGEIVFRLVNVMGGVRDPVIQVRPPASNEVSAELDPQQGVVATGNTRKLPTTVWHEIGAGDAAGWASDAYLTPLGAHRDMTEHAMEALGGDTTAETLEDLGLRVAGVFASTGEAQSRTVISSRPGVFEAVGDITVDVLGLTDDSERGYRIRVTADAGAQGGTQVGPGPFTLRSVGVAPMCYPHRGVAADGVCN